MSVICAVTRTLTPWFRGYDMEISVRGAMMGGAIFESMDLSRADFSDCSMPNVQFIRCNLKKTNFTGVDFGVQPMPETERKWCRDRHEEVDQPGTTC